MNGLRLCGLLAGALAATACGGPSQADTAPPNTPHNTPDTVSADIALVTAGWVSSSSCWKDVSAAALACTDQSAEGTLDAARTTCTYADGTVVHVDPAVTPASRFPWAFTVVSPTGTTCAQYDWKLGPTGALLKATVTTRLGTFSTDLSGPVAVFTCPDGSRFRVEDHTCDGALHPCGGDFYPPLVAIGGGPNPDGSRVDFGLYAPPGYLWRCRAP